MYPHLSCVFIGGRFLSHGVDGDAFLTAVMFENNSNSSREIWFGF